MECSLRVPHRVPSSPCGICPPTKGVASRAVVGKPLGPCCGVPEPGAVSQQHVQVALKGVLVQGTAQPGPASANVRGDVVQGIEALQLVLVEDLLHVDPEHRLCGEKQQGVTEPASCHLCSNVSQ